MMPNRAFISARPLPICLIHELKQINTGTSQRQNEMKLLIIEPLKSLSDIDKENPNVCLAPVGVSWINKCIIIVLKHQQKNAAIWTPHFKMGRAKFVGNGSKLACLIISRAHRAGLRSLRENNERKNKQIFGVWFYCHCLQNLIIWTK